MNVQDFTELLQEPQKVVSATQTKELEEILEEYPYFQAARAIHLKGLKNLNSFKYNSTLKVAAAYTADRDILFDFITSKEFLQNNIANHISDKISPEVTQKITPEKIVIEKAIIEASDDEPLPQTITEANAILNPNLFATKKPDDTKTKETEKNKAKKSLEIGEPLPFTKSEKYSFSEWLQLNSANNTESEVLKKPINKKNTAKLQPEEDKTKRKKFDLIDKFIASNPKITPVDKTENVVNVSVAPKFDKNELMTETLARVYLEQKKYKKAVQAYKILSLKYPEKSSFFADRIKAVHKLQQENS